MAHQVILTWVASVDVVDGYNIYRSASAGAETGSPINGTTPVTGTTFTDTNVTDGAFFYVARAVKGGVESVNSNEAEATILPAAPSGLTATGA
jgi:hypothetical protein